MVFKKIFTPKNFDGKMFLDSTNYAFDPRFSKLTPQILLFHSVGERKRSLLLMIYYCLFLVYFVMIIWLLVACHNVRVNFDQNLP